MAHQGSSWSVGHARSRHPSDWCLSCAVYSTMSVTSQSAASGGGSGGGGGGQRGRRGNGASRAASLREGQEPADSRRAHGHFELESTSEAYASSAGHRLGAHPPCVGIRHRKCAAAVVTCGGPQMPVLQVAP